MLHFLFVCLLAQLWSTFNTVHVSSVLHFSGFRREAKGAAKPLFISCIFKMFYNYSAILLSKSFNKMLFNSTFRAVNFIYYPLHHEYAHNAVCCMSRKVKFSFGGRGTRPRPSSCIFWIRPCSKTADRNKSITLHVTLMISNVRMD